MRAGQIILLVEDDLVDVKTVKRALDENGIRARLVVKRDGEEALTWLHGGKTATNGRPGLILLDLNMPKMTGLEFLRAVKADPDLRRIPVVVLTTSKEESDRVASFELGAAGYIIKPVDYEEFVDALRIVDHYWTLSELP